MARASSQDVIVLGARRRGRLEAMVAKATAPERLVLRAKIVLAAGRGESNATVARNLGDHHIHPDLQRHSQTLPLDLRRQTPQGRMIPQRTSAALH
ncbi:MAG: hypothetical protein ACRDTT_09580 [Pseudonocardiaceae bacterium]